MTRAAFLASLISSFDGHDKFAAAFKEALTAHVQGPQAVPMIQLWLAVLQMIENETNAQRVA